MGEPTSLDIVTLVIAVLGFCTAIGSLVWQVLSWRLTGSYVKVKSHRGVAVPDTTVHLVGITAYNKGRTPVAITGWGFKLPGDKYMPGPGFAPNWGGPPVPHTLQPGHSQGWNFPIQGIRETLREEGIRRTKVRPFVELGTGKEVIADGVDVSA